METAVASLHDDIIRISLNLGFLKQETYLVAQLFNIQTKYISQLINILM
jgi:hypothetical protein